MHSERTHITETAACIRLPVRLADGSCMSVMIWGQNFKREAGLIRKARM